MHDRLWFYGRNLCAGTLVYQDDRFSHSKKTHWFALRERPEEPSLMQWWPICPFGQWSDAQEDSINFYCLPSIEGIVTCGDCHDVLDDCFPDYEIVNAQCARFREREHEHTGI